MSEALWQKSAVEIAAGICDSTFHVLSAKSGRKPMASERVRLRRFILAFMNRWLVVAFFAKPILLSQSLLDELEARATASLDHIHHGSSAEEANSARQPLRKKNSGVSRPARLPNA